MHYRIVLLEVGKKSLCFCIFFLISRYNHVMKKIIPLTIPNLLSLFRIVVAPFLIIVAYLGWEGVFYIIFGLMLLSDALDGIVARALNQTSDLGAKLDSYGDIATYLTIPIAGWLLWSDLMYAQRYYIFWTIFIYILPSIFALVKFHQLVSYHTWITKISAITMCAGILVLFVYKDAYLFHVAIVILMIEAIENIIITLKLKTPKNNINSLWHMIHDK